MTEQRVSDGTIERVIGGAPMSLSTERDAVLDLRDARAEIAALRAKLATARDEWFSAGRDAAERAALETSSNGDGYHVHRKIRGAIRALHPPQAKP